MNFSDLFFSSFSALFPPDNFSSSSNWSSNYRYATACRRLPLHHLLRTAYYYYYYYYCSTTVTI